MCDEYARRYDNIQVIHKDNAGLGMACNTGIDAATGEYIAFLDSDDWVDSDMYEVMYEVANRTIVDVVYTGLKRVDGMGRILGYLPHLNEFKVYEGGNVRLLSDEMIASLPTERRDRNIQVSAKTNLYRLAFLKSQDIHFVSEREYPSEDLIFNVSVLMNANKACVIPKYFYNYFVNCGSITSTVKENHFVKMMRTALLLEKITQSRGNRVDSSTLTRISRFIIGESRSYSRQVIKSSLNVKEKRELIRKLSKNQGLINAVSGYPVRLMPTIHRILLYLLLNNQYRILQFIYKFS
jgi:glycosyltransferase involved in cell wall biosynthesis